MAEEVYTLITGASRGIGRALSTEMASRGRNLILASLPGEELDSLSTRLAGLYNIKVHYFEIDLTHSDGPENLFRATEKNGLKIDILINNAGIGLEGPIESYSRHEIDNMIFLNVRALTLLTFFFAPELKKRPSYILNIGSLGCYIPTAYKSVYLATKSYIYFFTRALESEFSGTKVRTCLFIPAAVRTNEKVRRRIEGTGLLSKLSALEPEEVASIGLKGMFKGRKVIVMGRFSRFVFALGQFIPEGIVMLAIRNMFRRENAL